VTSVSVGVGLTLVVGAAAYTWSLVRSIPVGVRRYVRSRMFADRFLLANIVLTAAMLALALAVWLVPGGPVVGLVALRPIAIANVVLFVMTLTRRR
jgi:hypothetical protein